MGIALAGLMAVQISGAAPLAAPEPAEDSAGTLGAVQTEIRVQDGGCAQEIRNKKTSIIKALYGGREQSRLP